MSTLGHISDLLEGFTQKTTLDSTLGHISDLLEGFSQLAKCNGMSKSHQENHSGPFLRTRGHISNLRFSQLAKLSDGSPPVSFALTPLLYLVT